jgi:N-acetylglucosamine kinase-like BadF-type ATPase
MRELLGKFPVRTVLAVDGGASKADVALVDVEGNVLAAVRRPGRFNFGLGSNGSLDGLARAIRSAQGEATAALGVFCLAGADLPVDDRRIGAELRSRSWAKKTLIRNDTFAVLRAGTDRKWGVAVVCGTGMNCAGIGPDGRFVRFPSFGELSGDRAHGGGWLGRAALGAAIRARDGRGPRTRLEQVVPAYFGMARPAAVMEAIYVGRLEYSRLFEIAPLVFQAAAAGDGVAQGMLDEMADEVVANATAAIRRLHLTRRDVHVVLGGGVLRAAGPDLLRRITDGIRGIAPEALITQLQAPPLVGAVLIGLDEVRASPAAHERVRRTLTHSRLGGLSARRRRQGRKPWTGVLGSRR